MAVPNLPTPGGSEDAWGDILNAAVMEIAGTADQALSIVETKADGDSVVYLSGAQSLSGEKTFQQPVASLSEPSADDHLTTKKYVDDLVDGIAIDDTGIGALVLEEESATRSALDSLYAGDGSVDGGTPSSTGSGSDVDGGTP